MTKVMNYYALTDFNNMLRTHGVKPLDKTTSM